VLVLMLVLGISAIRSLQQGASTARASRAEVVLVELLRDANSRQFESDRWQHMALRATDADGFKESQAEAVDVMQESVDGFRTFSKQARTPALRRDAVAQTHRLEVVQKERVHLLEFAAPLVGQPTPPRIVALVDQLEDRIEAIDVANDKMVTGEQHVTDGLADAASAEARSGTRRVIILLALATLLGAGISLLIARRLVRNARQLRQAARGIALGDLDQSVKVTGSDELAETAVAFDGMVSYVREMAAAGERISEGDLTVEVEPRGDSDSLGQAFSRMTESLRTTIGNVAQTAVDVNAASREVAETSRQTGDAVADIATAMEGVAFGAGEQLERVEGARRSATEVSDAVTRTTEIASRTAEVASSAHEIASAGEDAAERAGQAMAGVRAASDAAAVAIDALEAKSGQIGSIVEAITKIAEQTNLLALNAAIEAARAGEHGRGFAVVAEEVRRLAEDASGAAGQIGELIEQIRVETRNTVETVTTGAERTNASVTTVAETGDALRRVRGAIDDITERVAEIAGAAGVISGAAGRLQDDLVGVAEVAERSSSASQQVSASTQQSSAATQQITASATDLTEVAGRLEQMVAQFSLVPGA
jgi:methyl-accepting chemotaxis protein